MRNGRLKTLCLDGDGDRLKGKEVALFTDTGELAEVWTGRGSPLPNPFRTQKHGKYRGYVDVWVQPGVYSALMGNHSVRICVPVDPRDLR